MSRVIKKKEFQWKHRDSFTGTVRRNRRLKHSMRFCEIDFHPKNGKSCWMKTLRRGFSSPRLVSANNNTMEASFASIGFRRISLYSSRAKINTQVKQACSRTHLQTIAKRTLESASGAVALLLPRKETCCLFFISALSALSDA